MLTVIALEFAFLLGGLVVTEQVFNLNGLGLLFVAGDRPPRLHADAGPRAPGRRVFIIVNSWSISPSRGSTRGSGTGSRPAMAINPPVEVLADVAAAEPSARRLDGARQFVRRRPLGALGAAVIVLLRRSRVFAAAPGALRPPRQRLRRDAHPAERPALAGHRCLRARRLLAPALRLADGAAGGVRRLGARRDPRRRAGRRQRLLRRAAGPDPPARHGRLPVVPADHPGPGRGGDPGHRARPTSSWPSRSR